MVSSGALTEHLKFYHQVETQSESGYKAVVEELYLETRAERLKNKENYVVDAGELFHSSELTFRLRRRKEIQETDIVEYMGARYRITSLDVYPKDNQIIIIVSKINE
jgi:hypothetical protein